MNEQQGNMTAIEGNKLIAGFMSVKWDDSLKQWEYRPGHWYKELQYHSSWDWLWPVIRKIADIVINEDFNGHFDNALKAWRPICSKMEAISSIEKIFPSVVQFIIWYNNSQSPDKQKQL